jgi:hypothetical protein
MLRELNWFDPPKRCTAKKVDQIQSKLGVRLPDDYMKFLQAGGGGAPVETDFQIDEPRGVFHGSVGVFLSCGNDEYGLLPTLDGIASRRIEGLVPIAESGGGDFVCLDYRKCVDGVPTISYWHHGRYGMDDEVVAVCQRFGDFLELLHEPVDE